MGGSRLSNSRRIGEGLIIVGWLAEIGIYYEQYFPRMKREILGAIPTVVFFFVIIQLLALTHALILKGYGIEVSAFLKATITELVIRKVVLVADLLPMINRFPNKPLIYNILWKKCISMVAALLVRYVEDIIFLILEFKNLAALLARSALDACLLFYVLCGKRTLQNS